MSKYFFKIIFLNILFAQNFNVNHKKMPRVIEPYYSNIFGPNHRFGPITTSPVSGSYSCPQANPINISNDIYLSISKSTHHPTNKNPLP